MTDTSPTPHSVAAANINEYGKMLQSLLPGGLLVAVGVNVTGDSQVIEVIHQGEAIASFRFGKIDARPEGNVVQLAGLRPKPVYFTGLKLELTTVLSIAMLFARWQP